MTLTVGGSLNKNTAIVSGPGPPDLIRVCHSCAISGNFRQGMGGGIISVIFVCRQFETLTVFLIFFFSYTLSRDKGADKTSIAQAGLGICCSNVSCDKVHTIFKNPPDVYAEGCIVFVFPFVRSSFQIFVRLLVRS